MIMYLFKCCHYFQSFRDLFVAGEHMDKDTMRWTRKAISAPVYDNWWQTGRETLGLFTATENDALKLKGFHKSRISFIRIVTKSFSSL